MTGSHDDMRRQAVALAAETMGEIIDFWGFKASMGRIWTLLYLSRHPMPADLIGEQTQLSAGAVSMGLNELMQWGLVSRAPLPGERKRHYRAETDIWAIVRRIVRERELRLVGRAVQRFDEAIALLEEAREQAPDDPEIAFALERLRGLLELARIGYHLVESLAEFGQFSLLPIRNALLRPQDGR